MAVKHKMDFSESVPQTVRHYLERIRQVLRKLEHDPQAERLFAIRLAPDMLDTGFNLAIAIGFAARALCLPAGVKVPELPEQHDPKTLLVFLDEIANMIVPLTTDDFVTAVSHRAGDAQLTQETTEYVSCFALPNMIFHFSMGYAGLRHGGLAIGKADFDGFHIYE